MNIWGIKKRANILLNGLEVIQLENDNSRVVTKNNNPADIQKELLAITFNVSEDTQMGMDSVFKFTQDALSTIADSEAKTEEELREKSHNIEANTYTSDLTSWLNENNNHVYYLTEALEEYGIKDGFSALAVAQQRAREETYNIVLNWLIEHLN